MIPIDLMADVCERENAIATRPAGAHEGEASTFSGDEENTRDSFEHAIPRSAKAIPNVTWGLKRDEAGGVDLLK